MTLLLLFVHCLTSSVLATRLQQSGIYHAAFEEGRHGPCRRQLIPANLKSIGDVEDTEPTDREAAGWLFDHFRTASEPAVSLPRTPLDGHRSSERMSDILQPLDCGNLAVLTLLDLSAVLDTVDHATLLRRLSVTHGLHVLRWFESYINGRT
jgi:hypothetical protein